MLKDFRHPNKAGADPGNSETGGRSSCGKCATSHHRHDNLGGVRGHAPDERVGRGPLPLPPPAPKFIHSYPVSAVYTDWPPPMTRNRWHRLACIAGGCTDFSSFSITMLPYNVGEYARTPPNERPIFIYEWLRNLEEDMPTVSKVCKTGSFFLFLWLI